MAHKTTAQVTRVTRVGRVRLTALSLLAARLASEVLNRFVAQIQLCADQHSLLPRNLCCATMRPCCKWAAHLVHLAHTYKKVMSWPVHSQSHDLKIVNLSLTEGNSNALET